MKLNIDNPFFSVMGHLADLVIVNLLFVLASLPIVTIGASRTALYQVLGKIKDGTEGTVYRTYFGIFAAEFKRTWKSWLVLLGCGVLLFADLFISIRMLPDSVSNLLLPFLGGMTFLYLMIYSRMYLEPMEEDGSVRSDLKEAFLMAVRHFPQTILMIVIRLFPLFIYQISFRSFAAFMLPAMLLIWFSISGFVYVILDRTEKKQKGALRNNRTNG